jgi:hypothetical protein
VLQQRYRLSSNAVAPSSIALLTPLCRSSFDQELCLNHETGGVERLGDVSLIASILSSQPAQTDQGTDYDYSDIEDMPPRPPQIQLAGRPSHD